MTNECQVRKSINGY